MTLSAVANIAGACILGGEYTHLVPLYDKYLNVGEYVEKYFEECRI